MVGSYDGCWGRLEDALAGSFGGTEGRNWTITPSRMPSPRPDPPARSCCLFPPPQVAEYENCRLLLVDKQSSTARDIIGKATPLYTDEASNGRFVWRAAAH